MIIVNAAIIRILAIGLSYIVNLTIINMVLKETAGQYFLYLAWSSLITVILVGGYSKYIVRELAKNYNYEIALRNSSYKYVTIIFIIATLIALLVASQKSEVAILAITIPLLIYLSVESSLLRGKGNHVWGNVEGQIIRPIILLILLYFGLTAIDEASILHLISLYAVGIILSSALWFVLVTPKKRLTETKLYKFDFKSLNNLTVISIAELAFLQLDIILLGFLMTNESIAEYKVALLVRMALLVPQQALLMVLPYVLAKSPKTLYIHYLRFINLATGTIGLIVNYSAGEMLIGLAFGEDYGHVSKYLYPYFVMMLCLGVIGPASETLIAVHRDYIVRKAAVYCVILNSAMLILTVPVYGIHAAIFSGATSYTLFYVICYWHSKYVKTA